MEPLEKVNAEAQQIIDESLTPEVSGEIKSEAETQTAETIESVETEKNVTIPDVMARLNELVSGDGSAVTNEELSRIKQQFYGAVNELMAYQRDEFIAAGNDAEQFTPIPVAEEPEFKALLAQAKELKSQYRARIEAEQAKTLDRKREIIEELNKMAQDTDNVNRHYAVAKELQAEFKSLGEVPQQFTTQIWKEFQDVVELFYDQWKVNRELRDYDFKKNLSEKQLLVEEAKALVGENDVVVAFRRLQELHEKWREIGPVAKDLREDIWAQFKDASAEINKRYQAFFEERKQREQSNEAAKTALCERIEAIDLAQLNTYALWNKATETIMDTQSEWKSLGYASRKVNNQLFARFRACCDKFFAAKAEFFQTMKNSLVENLEAKTRLCEKAEELSQSSDWRKTSDALVALQKEWKTIGPVAKKQSDAVWQRFLNACNTFFERKKEATSGVRRTEQANLKAKRAIIARLTELNEAELKAETRKDSIAEINALRAKWQETGHVPFREKDKLHEVYREVVRQLFDRYDIHEKRAHMDSFEASIDAMGTDKSKMLRERDRLMRSYEARKSELATYENNLSFLSARSRSGASMLGDIEHNIQRLKGSIAELETKIKLIDSKLS